MKTHMKPERTSKTRRARFASVLAVVAIGGVALGACGDDDEPAASTGTTTMAPEMGEETSQETGDIVAVASEAGDFTVLLAAATQAGLVDELQGPGPLTVFAPTDEAFAEALGQLGLTRDELLADTGTLKSILLYHVVEGEVPSAQVVELDGEEVETLNGATVTIGVDGESVTLNDDVNVVTTDIGASNGVIHVIDAVLLPPSE